MCVCVLLLLYYSAGVGRTGVGRTGTFITVDHILEQREEEGVIDIPGVIQNLRQQRLFKLWYDDKTHICVYMLCVREFKLGLGLYTVGSRYCVYIQMNETICGKQKVYY